MPPYAVSIEHITHRYGETVALHEVSLDVAEGTLLALLGPNGGGKTTLFRILSTLLEPKEGTASVFGFDTTGQPDAVRQCLGVIFQQPALDDELTVLENLRFHGALHGLSGAVLQQRIEALLSLFGVADRQRDRVKNLSGGLQRRVDLSRGLLHRPALLLLDEPTTGLDPMARRAFWQTLSRLRHEEGTTMMLATHLLEEAEAADYVGIIDHGRLVAQGTPSALKQGVGGETLWIESTNPMKLKSQIQQQFGVEAQIIGNALQLASSEAPSLLTSFYSVFGDEIVSATVRKPTLEDVFLIHTGHALTAGTPALEAVS